MNYRVFDEILGLESLSYGWPMRLQFRGNLPHPSLLVVKERTKKRKEKVCLNHDSYLEYTLRMQEFFYSFS